MSFKCFTISAVVITCIYYEYEVVHFFDNVPRKEKWRSHFLSPQKFSKIDLFVPFVRLKKSVSCVYSS